MYSAFPSVGDCTLADFLGADPRLTSSVAGGEKGDRLGSNHAVCVNSNYLSRRPISNQLQAWKETSNAVRERYLLVWSLGTSSVIDVEKGRQTR